MTVVLLHGVPETPVIWDPLVAELERHDIVTPQLPGFGCAPPKRFGASKDEYVLWLVAQLEPIVDEHGPVDFVGHDWGGLIGLGAVAMRPHLFRTWACDVLGAFHADYVWHPAAQLWQTPGAGEEYVERSTATPVDARAAAYESIGIPRATGEPLAEAWDDVMGHSILSLYRSAAQPAMREWGEQLAPASTVPGLAILAPDDPYVLADPHSREVAVRMGATVHVLEGQGHFWMLGDPATGAAMLTSFWSEAY